MNSEALQYFDLASQLAARGQLRKSLAAFRAVTRLAPRAAAGWSNRANIAARLGVVDEPETCYRKAILLAPCEEKFKVRLGFLLIGQARLDEADILFANATSPMAVCGRAQVLEARGQLRPALTLLQDVLHLCYEQPRIGVVFARLARRLGEPAEGAALLATMPESTESLFELGRCLDAAERFDEAWACFVKANRSTGRFDVEAFQSSIRTERAAPRSHTGTTDGSRMVFIVGMPRSGTSLLEQALSRHPSVTALGEREVVPRMAREMAAAGWPDLSPEQLDALASRYLEGLPERGLITDKMPGNWRHLDLIRQMLPGATIVHCIRDIQDCLLSNFMQNYSSTALGWSTSLEGLAAYRSAWSTADIGGHEVHYEEMVSKPEQVIPDLLARLGLPDHPACLRPEESDRLVATASYAQVQKPIHTKSIGRAKAYRRHLAA